LPSQPRCAAARRTAVAAKSLLDSFRWQAAAIALLILVAYANSLPSSFHFDDSTIFVDPVIVSPGFGQNPVLYDSVNVLLHAANCILLLALARRYLSPFTAACVAVLFATSTPVTRRIELFIIVTAIK